MLGTHFERFVNCDDSDIKREIRNMYIRTNMLLTQRFKGCSVDVKIRILGHYIVGL